MRQRHIYTILLLVVFLLSSCARDMQTEVINSSEEVSIQLSLKVPGIGSGGSSNGSSQRSITLAEESDITTVDILAFHDAGGGNMRFAYKATNISMGTPVGNDLTVTATVKGYLTPQQFIVLANSSAELAAITIHPGEALADVVRKLVCAAGNGEFPARINGDPNPAAFKYIPMYAKTTSQLITPTTGSIGNYPMLRMIARVNVTVAGSVTNFQLVEAALYNYKKAGYIGYDFSSFNTGTNTATVAAVPTSGDHTGTPILEPTVWHDAVSNVIHNSIFTYESPAITTESEMTEKTALVVGGYYNGDTSKKVYYRIDLKTTDDVSTNISSPILRNHSYNVEIQSVSGPGTDNGLDAYKGKVWVGVHIEAAPWTEVDIDGDILGRELNVSALEKVLLNANTERVYFNSNQPVVTLDNIGLNSANANVPIANIIDNPAGSFHYTYNNVTKIGTGYIDLTASSAATSFNYRIYINAGGLKREVKVIVPPNITGSGTPPSGITPYVGAFWRASQKGERVINIKTGTTTGNLGA